MISGCEEKKRGKELMERSLRILKHKEISRSDLSSERILVMIGIMVSQNVEYMGIIGSVKVLKRDDTFFDNMSATKGPFPDA